jgi:hypothetical protein
LVESSEPLCTSPGWPRQVNGVAVGINVGGVVGVAGTVAVEVEGIAIGVGAEAISEEQPESPTIYESKRIR